MEQTQDGFSQSPERNTFAKLLFDVRIVRFNDVKSGALIDIITIIEMINLIEYPRITAGLPAYHYAIQICAGSQGLLVIIQATIEYKRGVRV